jgi:hypothetical protein
MSDGFKYGFFATPSILALISFAFQDICSVWLIFGLFVPLVIYFGASDDFWKNFAIGSLVGMLVFIIPWFGFTASTDLICYNTVWSTSC